MTSFNFNASLAEIDTERRILSLVETLNEIDSSIGVMSYYSGGNAEYNSIVWDDPDNKQKFSQEYLEQERISKTKDQWLVFLMEEANLIQSKALSLHTISVERTLQQKQLYDIKYLAAVKYIEAVSEYRIQNNTDANYMPSTSEVSVDNIILYEADATGDPVYYLCLAIIYNYLSSEDTLTTFYGLVEGIRRVAKKRIIACTTVSELENVEWATWPSYEGNPESPSD